MFPFHNFLSSIRDKLGYALSLKWVKSIVLMMFTAYLVVAIWGITNLKEGLEKRNTVNFDSYSIPFFDADDKYYMVRNIVFLKKKNTSFRLSVCFCQILLLVIPVLMVISCWYFLHLFLGRL